MEKQRIVWLCILHQPVHRSQDVLLRRLTHWILLVIGENHHILTSIPEVLVQVGRHVLDIVDASSQLPSLTKVVDSNQKSLPSAATV